MKQFAKKIPFCFSVLCAMLIAASLPDAPVLSADDPLIGGLVIEKVFKPGSGQKIGSLLMVQGDAFIVHAGDEKTAYRAGENLPLFKGDTLITLKKGRLQLELSDTSVLTVASETRLTLTRSVFDAERKTRSSFVDMFFGKVRYVVKKYTDFGTRDFKVKTKTAIVGVRGSDFIVKSGEKYTEVISLENTELEIIRLAALEEKPSLLADFEKIVIEMDAMPSEIMKISPEEVDLMIKEMTVMPETEEEPAVPEEETSADSSGESADAEQAEERTSEAESSDAEIMVPDIAENDLFVPEDMEETGSTVDAAGFENDMSAIFNDDQSVLDAQEEIIENNVKESIIPSKSGDMISLPRPPKE